jgi:hypothetical protein
MNPHVLRPTLTLGALALAGLTALAGPLRRADVAADPTWALHLDVDALRPTAIGQSIQAEMNKPEAQEKLAAFQAIVSFDLRTQLHGLTLYGTTASPEDGVLVVYADIDPERLVTLAKAAHDSQNSAYKSHVIYNWIDDNKKAHHTKNARVYAAIAGSRIVFGQKEKAVAQALDVIDGAASSLAAGHSMPQLGAVGDTSIIQAAARKMDLPDTDPHAALLRLSKMVRLQVGEAQSQLNATLTLEANDEEVAGHMSSIAQGLIALGKLQNGKPEAIKLANAMALKQDGSRLVVNLNLPANEVIEMMKADAARKAAKHGQ